MDELLALIQQYDPYYEMADDNRTWQRGRQIHNRIRELVERLRAEGYGAEVDAILDQHPGLVASPNGQHVLA
jgi:hypothetical protein